MPEAIRKLLGELTYSEIFIEEGNPESELGLNYDIYVNNVNYEVFKKENNLWVAKGFCGDANINPDWDETDTNKKNYILNKPDVATKDLVKSLEDSLNTNITDLESLIKSMGVLGFNYDEQKHTLSIVRPNNTVDNGMTFPVCDGLKPGFIDVDTYLQVLQSKQDIFDEVNSRVTTDVKSSDFNSERNTLVLTRSDETTLEQVFPKLLAGDGINISNDENDNLLIQISDFELFVPVANLDAVTDPEQNKIYLIPNGSDDGNNFDEYIWFNDSWEIIGSLSVDLSNYYTKDEVQNLINPLMLEIENLQNQVTELVNNKADSSELSIVAITGDYEDLTNKPPKIIIASNETVANTISSNNPGDAVTWPDP